MKRTTNQLLASELAPLVAEELVKEIEKRGVLVVQGRDPNKREFLSGEGSSNALAEEDDPIIAQRAREILREIRQKNRSVKR